MPKKLTSSSRAYADPQDEQEHVPESSFIYSEDHADRETNNPFEDPNHPTRWVHRRRMAYASLISIFIVTAYLLSTWVDNERINALSDIIEWFYFSMASIVGAYMGFASWSALRGRIR